MEKNINTQLNIIEKAIKWVKETDSMKGAKGENVYRNLVNSRRKLNKKKFALEGNPAAAMYGESQAGKSYLVSALLSTEGKLFKVIDGNGNEFDFKNQINPRGNEMESTSVATRFSTKYKWINKDYPIIAKLLSPTDIILVICEAYYNNLKVNNPLSFDNLKEKISLLELQYSDKNQCQENIIEDNILDIEEYFNDNFSKLVFNNLKDAGFFEKVSLIVTKVPSENWKDVFSLLWNFNPQLTKLFDDLIIQYRQIDFTNIVYLPIDAVLRDKGTLLDVSRLDEIYDSFKGQEINYSEQTTIFFKDISGSEKTLIFSKPFLCALSAEIIFVLPDELINQKPFLAHTDLLDFPGTRRFESTNEESISDKSLTVLLRRGRVDYLFNKYSSYERINALLFCQNHKQSSQSVMPEKLNRWIGNMIGVSPEEREKFRTPVSPLFIISTWFNKDMEFDFNNDKQGDTQSFNERWHQRFIKTLSGEIIKTSDYKWLHNWTISNKFFQNIYLLRDLDKSSETNSQIFRGFNENNKELEEIKPESYPNFRVDLRKSFLNFDFVKQHFETPENSWDRAASINEDGTQLIIDKLNIAASNINTARHEKSVRELQSILENIITFLKEHYNSSDKAENLLKAIATAGNVQANLAIAFGRNPYFFGTMMRELMMNNSDVYNIYMNKIRDIERRDVVNMDQYIGIRLQVSELDPNAPFETNLEYLRKHFEKRTIEECRDFFEKEKEIDLYELFYGNKARVKSFSQVLAKELETFWFEDYIYRNQQVLSEILSKEGLHDMQDMLRRLYGKLNITEIIAERIRRYVDGYRNIEDVYEMIADISAEMINKFINTVGLVYYNESNYNDLKKVSENINGLSWEHNELQFEKNTKSDVAELITQMGNLPELLNQNPLPKQKLKFLPNYRNYIMWYDLLKAGFVTASGVPNYDPIANENLGTIIKEFESIEY
jgi:hypothetical protein